MKKFVKTMTLVMMAMLMLSVFVAPALAEETAEVAATTDASIPFKAISAAIAIAAGAGLGALAMGQAIAKSVEAIARQPEAAGNIRTSLMLGMVFIETAIIYALIVAILVIFVL